MQTLHSTDASRVHAQLVHEVTATADADVTVICFARAAADGGVVATCFSPGVPQVGVLWNRAHANRAPPFFVQNPRPADVDRFIDDAALLGPGGLGTSSIHDNVLAPMGIRHQTRIVFRDAAGTMSLLGAYRQSARPFTRSDNERLTRRAAAFRARWALGLRLQELPELGADLVVRPDGVIEGESARARGWLRIVGFEDAVARTVVAADRGEDEHVSSVLLAQAMARVVRLDGAGGVRYLVHIERTAPLQRDALDALSGRQRAVAERCGQGESLLDVADALGISRETAKKHLAAAYRALGVSSRAELARVFEARAKHPASRAR